MLYAVQKKAKTQKFLMQKEKDYKKIESPINRKNFEEQTQKEYKAKEDAVLKFKVTKEEEVLKIISEMRSQRLNNFDLDRKLYEAINEFNKYKENNNDLRKNESFIKIDVSLNESEAEIEALRKYYNDIISDYNKIIKTIPSNIVAKLSKLKTKDYFEGKDLSENGKAVTKI